MTTKKIDYVFALVEHYLELEAELVLADYPKKLWNDNLIDVTKSVLQFISQRSTSEYDYGGLNESVLPKLKRLQKVLSEYREKAGSPMIEAEANGCGGDFWGHFKLSLNHPAAMSW